jgi:hypothetical protein
MNKNLEQLREETIKKWEKVGLLEGLSDEFKKGITINYPDNKTQLPVCKKMFAKSITLEEWNSPKKDK